MEEKLIQYVWQLKQFPLEGLQTVDGQPVQVLDQGLLNTNSGPDFFNAKIKIADTVWVGNVEIHDVASMWHSHGHNNDKAYDSVILHVVRVSDERIHRTNGEQIPQMVLPIPEDIESMYDANKASKSWIPCADRIGKVSSFTIHSWLDTCLVQRLNDKTKRVEASINRTKGDWSTAMYESVARSLGFGTNSQAMESLAMSTPLGFLLKHKDNIEQVFSMLLGQSSLLPQATARDDAQHAALSQEYSFLRAKFNLSAMSREQWKTGRMRPNNLPWVRIDQLAYIICHSSHLLSKFVENPSLDYIRLQLKDVKATHYGNIHLGKAAIDSVIINAVVPVLFLYGKLHTNSDLEEKATAMLEKLPAESNSVAEGWRQYGIDASSAFESQALIQLKREYCERKDCLRCRLFWAMRSK